MGAFSAWFFARLQAAGFYRELHAEAVAAVGPVPEGADWLDVGCGPGLVARLAAEAGWRAAGVDRDPAMIAEARALDPAGRVAFEVGDLDVAEAHGHAVVSAGSLLVGVPDRRAALVALARRVRPGGTLLIVETTAALTPRAALAEILRRGARPSDGLWLVWALARRRVEAVAADDLALDGWSLARHDLGAGLVAAWILRRAA